MSCIDLNSIGRSLFKQRYNIEDKRKLTFSELQWYVDDILTSFKNNSENLIHPARETVDFIGTLNSLLLFCYIQNIDLNKYIQLTLNEEIK